VQDRQLRGDNLDFDIVGNDETLEPSLESWLKCRIGIDQKRIAIGVHEQMRVHFTFRVQHAGFDRAHLRRLANVVRDLTVEKADTIRSADAKLYSRRKIKERAIGNLRRHSLTRPF
jgi:hypothetical protein